MANNFAIEDHVFSPPVELNTNNEWIS